MKPLHDMLLPLHNRSSREVYQKQSKPSALLKIKVWNEKFKSFGMSVWWEFGQMGEMRVKTENERKEMRGNKWEFGQIPSSLAILYSRKWLEITIQRSSRVQKYN